jgi:glycerate 2-kinase
MRVVAAADKFRGTATAREVVMAIGRAVEAAGGVCDLVPLADGGEGTLDVLGGANRSTTVTGPLGDPVVAGWRLVDRVAVIEMARASGLALVGGAEGNDAIAAATHGTGELIAAALDAGARRIIVALGGSATTDGGLGALRAVWPTHRLKGVELVGACDVRTLFVDAAEVFAPQKGATSAQVALLRRRLERLADLYRDEYGVDVRELIGSGAAGGLGGALAAIGAELVAGFEVVADEVGLAERIDGADLVITGEGILDQQSFEGKVVGGVTAMALGAGVPVLAVAGEVLDGAADRVEAVSLVERFGRDDAMWATTACIEDAVTTWLQTRGSSKPR